MNVYRISNISKISKYKRYLPSAFWVNDNQPVLITENWKVNKKNEMQKFKDVYSKIYYYHTHCELSSPLESPQVSWTFLSILVDLNSQDSVDLQLFQFTIQSLRRPFQVCKLQLVSPSTSCSTVFFFSSHARSIVYLFIFFYFHSLVRWNDKIHLTTKFSFFL